MPGAGDARRVILTRTARTRALAILMECDLSLCRAAVNTTQRGCGMCKSDDTSASSIPAISPQLPMSSTTSICQSWALDQRRRSRPTCVKALQRSVLDDVGGCERMPPGARGVSRPATAISYAKERQPAAGLSDSEWKSRTLRAMSTTPPTYCCAFACAVAGL